MAKIEPVSKVEFNRKGRNQSQTATSTVFEEDELKNFHYMSIEELKKALHINDLSKGLSNLRAQSLLEKNGKNILKPKYAVFFFGLIKNLFNGFTCLLSLSFILSFISIFIAGKSDSKNRAYFIFVCVIILIIIFVQLIFSILQAVQAIMSSKDIDESIVSYVVTVRDGQRQKIPSTDLVVGDIVILSVNEKVAADLRLIEVKGLRLDKSTITGESEPIDATVSILYNETKVKYADATNMAFMNSVVVFGTGKGVVVATGNQTLMSKISFVIESRQNQLRNTTFLQRELTLFALFVFIIALLLVIIYVIVWATFIRYNDPKLTKPLEVFLEIATIFLGSLPYSLPLAFFITIVINTKLLKKLQVLIKNYSCFETLSCMNVIAFDKTGTLTQNKLTVINVMCGDNELEASECRFDESEIYHGLNRASIQILASCYLCNNFKLVECSDNSIDLALGRFAESNLKYQRIGKNYRILQEIEFSSANKYDVKLFEPNDSNVNNFLFSNLDSKQHIMIIKGAPDLLKSKLKFVVSSDGSCAQINEESLYHITEVQNKWSLNGNRVVMLCKKYIDTEKIDKIYDLDKYFRLECNDLTFIGLVALADPPRPGLADIMRQFHTAGIRTIMLKGDYSLTAASIAYQSGMLADPTHHDTLFKLHKQNQTTSPNPEQLQQQIGHIHRNKSIVLSGTDLDLLTELEWKTVCVNYDEIILARAAPLHKLRCTKELKSNGYVVGMLGDGSNDIPSIKDADIGIAMGSGNRVTIQSANLILLDDSLTNLLECILKSRLYYENLRKIFFYLLPACFFTELLFIISNTVLGTPMFLSSYSMFFICLFTDLIPSIALIFEKPEESLLLKSPRSIRAHILDTKLIFHAFLNSIYLSFFSLLSFFTFFYFFSSIKIQDLFFLYNSWETNGVAGYTTEEYLGYLYGAQTTCFLSIVLIQTCGNLYAIRTRYLSLFHSFPLFKKHYNPLLFLFSFLSLLTILSIIYFPFFQNIFNTQSVPFRFYPMAIGYSLGIISLDELRKFLLRKGFIKKWLAW